MIVTTLPITPGKHTSFMTFLGPLIADVFAKLSQNNFKMVLNIKHSFQSFNSKKNKYVQQLQCLNIFPELIEFDNSDIYYEHIQKTVKALFARKFLKIKESEIVYCDCGIVELPFIVYSQANKEKRLKYIQEEKCIKCHQKIKRKVEKVLALRCGQDKNNINVAPRRYRSQFENLYCEEMIISRNHRQGTTIELENNLFVLDSDFCWATYLVYLIDIDFCLIAGADTILHAKKAIAILKALNPTAKIDLIIHPLLQIIDGKKGLSKFSIEEYLVFCENSFQIARTFLLLGVQWTKRKSKLKESDLYWVKKSVFPKQHFICDKSSQSLFSFELIQRNKILELLKLMRGHSNILTYEHWKLKEFLLN